MIMPANGDILPPGMKVYDRCVSISNLGDYHDVVFVGYITGPVIQCENPYIINSSECLTQFYKANKLTVYAIEKDYFENKGLENIDFESDPNILPYNFDFNVDWGHTVVANPLTKEEIYYSVAGFNDTALILYAERKVSFYGSVIDREETYGKPSIPDMRVVFNESKVKTETESLVNGSMESKEASKINETSDVNSSEGELNLKDTILCFFRKLFGNDC
ncbi:hypothetical protein [Methanolobus bombayensis]|uniref:hypothetical protein n=1 Tax=Methanolobus bombayensis TaxID=38023 RepID=UPI001AE156DB|nr:hypothetical protein [Methanolobus bombayensis]MBP1908471.1 hypothetical protein [Methanolobus bombayensis]